jgi:hypothetical protein
MYFFYWALFCVLKQTAGKKYRQKLTDTLIGIYQVLVPQSGMSIGGGKKIPCHYRFL